MWCRRNSACSTRGKTKTSKRIHLNLFKQHSLRGTTTTREREDAFFVVVISIGLKSALIASSHKKSANVVTTKTRDGTSGYGNSLPFVLSVCNSPQWWTDSGANIHVCADVSLFSSYQVGRSGTLLMGNGSRAHVLGVGTVISKFTLGKTVSLKSVQHVPSIKKNLVSASMLCRDSYKVVFESNKYVVWKHGTFVGKGYDCGCFFRLSLHDECIKMVNFVNISDESDLWHSCFCHVTFGCLMQLQI